LAEWLTISLLAKVLLSRAVFVFRTSFFISSFSFGARCLDTVAILLEFPFVALRLVVLFSIPPPDEQRVVSIASLRSTPSKRKIHKGASIQAITYIFFRPCEQVENVQVGDDTHDVLPLHNSSSSVSKHCGSSRDLGRAVEPMLWHF
jgi:hypothetical protein